VSLRCTKDYLRRKKQGYVYLGQNGISEVELKDNSLPEEVAGDSVNVSI